jgi:potassium voltage-gated channel Eag-related subfamily H protein 8
MRYLGTLLELLVDLVLICYTLGCLWFWWVRQVDNEKYADFNFIDDNLELVDVSLSTKVLRSCYFILTTVSTVGYGDYLPKNVYEFAFDVIIMLIGVGTFSYIMGSLNASIEDYNKISSS